MLQRTIYTGTAMNPKSKAVKRAIEEMLRPVRTGGRSIHPFIGGDKGDGSDVSGTIKTELRARIRGSDHKASRKSPPS